MIIICTILSNVCAIYGNNGRGGRGQRLFRNKRACFRILGGDKHSMVGYLLWAVIHCASSFP